jgi:hypothetical protein
MHTTPEQERFYEAVEQTVASLGGMKTKFNAFPLTLATSAGVLRVKPVFDGVECRFDQPDRATSLFPGLAHRMKGTFKIEIPLGSHDDASYQQALAAFRETVVPLLVQSKATVR